MYLGATSRITAAGESNPIVEPGRPRAAAALVLALLILSSCHRARSDADLQRTFDAANLAFRRGELTEAQTLSERGMKSAGPQADSVGSWRFRLLRGDILISERNLGEVRSLTHAAVPAGASFDSLRAQQALLDARLMIAERRLDDALSLAKRVGEIAPQDRQLRFYAAMHVGQILFQKGRWDEGESLLAGTARAASEAGDRYYEAFALQQLGMGQFVRNRFDQALAFFERVLAFSDLSEMSIYAKALNNAGMCYSRLGMFERAVDVQRRAVALQAKYPRSSDYEQALGQLGNTYLLQQNLREGTSYVQHAFEVARDSGITGDAMLWAGNLAHAQIERGQWDEADRYNEEAKGLSTATRSGDAVYYTLRSATIASGRQRFDVASRLFEQALADANASPAVVWNAQAGLADVAMARDDPARASRHFEAALTVIERSRSDLLKTDYKLSYLTQLISFYRKYVEALLRQGRTERALEIA